jgi:hypothetical protein
MRRSILAIALLLAALAPAAANAACPVIPFVFNKGAVWNSDQVNANFASIRDCASAGAGLSQVLSTVALRALAANAAPMIYRQYNVVPGDGSAIYSWQSFSTCTDDALTCVKPSSNPPAGRWVLSTTVAAGASTATDNRVAALTTQGAALAGSSAPGLSAMTIANAAFIIPSGIQIYDGIRGVAHGVAGSTTNLVNGVSGYVQNDQAIAPSGFPTSVALFGAGVSASDGAITWGLNTLLSDSTSTGISTGTGRGLNNELDFNITSAGTTVNALLIAGGALVQPTYANGIALNYLDGASQGTVAKWSFAYLTADGATHHFAQLGSAEVSGANVNSQDITWVYRNAGNVGKTAAAAWTPLGLLIATQETNALRINLDGPGAYATGDGGGVNINGRIVMQGVGTTLNIGGDTGYTSQFYSNNSAGTRILGTPILIGTLGGGTSVSLEPDVVTLTNIPLTPGGRQPVCIDTTTRQIYYGNAGVC